MNTAMWMITTLTMIPFTSLFMLTMKKNSLDTFGLVIYMYVYSVSQIEKCPTCKGTSTLPT